MNIDININVDINIKINITVFFFILPFQSLCENCRLYLNDYSVGAIYTQPFCPTYVRRRIAPDLAKQVKYTTNSNNKNVHSGPESHKASRASRFGQNCVKIAAAQNLCENCRSYLFNFWAGGNF